MTTTALYARSREAARLESQLTSCRELAVAEGLLVDEQLVFKDNGGGAGGKQTLVQCNVRHLPHFPGDMQTRQFCFVLVAGGQVAVATHRVSESQMEAVLLGLQACCCASGRNYKPWAIWPDEQMDAAEGRLDPPAPGVITATVMTLDVAHKIRRELAQVCAVAVDAAQRT